MGRVTHAYNSFSTSNTHSKTFKMTTESLDPQLRLSLHRHWMSTNLYSFFAKFWIIHFMHFMKQLYQRTAHVRACGCLYTHFRHCELFDAQRICVWMLFFVGSIFGLMRLFRRTVCVFRHGIPFECIDPTQNVLDVLSSSICEHEQARVHSVQ